ncbi:MAG: hypothetical protein QOG49_1265 [Frankiaceae bacterium]|jgi:hypothetical protein|nr:hypothetical protein [Frankiaceae bacterium]
MPELRRDPPPLRTNDAKTVAVGTALWLVVLVGLAVGHDRVRRDERWWYAACACGIALGLLGLLYLRIRPAQLARKQKARDEARSSR